MREPLPPFYYYFFWLLEPSLSLSGAIYAIFSPEKYGADLLPLGVERVTKIVGETTRGQMLIGGLGSCFLLLALISLSLFYLFKNSLGHLPELQEKMVRGLLIPLAITDLTHIALTLLPLPMSLLETPSKWTTVINGNVWITIGLFVVRMAWLLGIGRHPTTVIEKNAAKPISEKSSTPPPASEGSSSDTSKATPSTRGRTRGGKKAAAEEIAELGN